MYLEKEKLCETMKKCEQRLINCSIPKWEEIPNIDLYMDQVIPLLEEYLGVLGDEKVITQPMINNYVKLGIMPPPVKKKYSKSHIAYLIVICFLKHTLSMGTIQKIMPVGMSKEEVEEVYRSFVENKNKAFEYVMDNIKQVAVPILDTDSVKRMNDLVIQISVASNICKVITEEIVRE